MQQSGFFPDIDGDRLYTDEFLAQWIASFVGNGVYPLELGVVPGSGMQVVVQPGRGWINGRYYNNTEQLPLSIKPADGVFKRYDAVILRADTNARSITADVLTGLPSANPTRPQLTRTPEIYEIKMCDIFLPAGATMVTADHITDTRLDNSVCGLVAGVVDQINTESMYGQFGALLALIQQELEQLNAGTEVMLKTAYDPDNTGSVKAADNAAKLGGNAPAYYATAAAVQAAQNTAAAAMPMAGGQFTGQVAVPWGNVQGAGLHNIRCQNITGYDVAASTIITRRK